MLLAQTDMTNKLQQPGCADLLSDKSIVVVGLGVSGISSVEFIAKYTNKICIMDSRAESLLTSSLAKLAKLNKIGLKFDIVTGGFDQEKLNSADLIVVSPGVPLSTEEIKTAISNNVSVIGDVEIFAQCVAGKIVAITGSNGKTTVTSLLSEMASLSDVKYRVGGNIGTPVLDLLDDVDGTDFYILELSSFQLETTNNLNAKLSIVLNASEDHMDRYDSFDSYVETKEKININSEMIISNNDEPNFYKSSMQEKVKYTYGLSKPENESMFGLARENDVDWLMLGNKKLLPVAEIKLKGTHNYSNVLAALALGSAMNLSMRCMLEAVRRFVGLAHRTQWVESKNGVEWFNDSKATNVGATIAAIKGFEPNNNLILILGGQGKGQDFSLLNEVLVGATKQIYIYGEDAQLIDDSIQDSISTQRVKTLSEAVSFANNIAASGDTVLLSPACASFDMFRGYEHRGNEFIRLVSEVHV